MSTHTASEHGDFGFQIAPMVDVVFVLLLFFMACAGQAVTERLLQVPLPSGPREGIVENLVVDIDAVGNVSVNGLMQPDGVNDHELPAFRAHLKTVKDVAPEIGVIIRPAGDATHERMIDVLGTCHQVGVRKILFQ